MALTITQMRAIPLLVLGAGVLVLAATVEVPADRTGPAIDVPALHAGAYTLGTDPSVCADSIAPECVIDPDRSSFVVAAP